MLLWLCGVVCLSFCQTIDVDLSISQINNGRNVRITFTADTSGDQCVFKLNGDPATCPLASPNGSHFTVGSVDSFRVDVGYDDLVACSNQFSSSYESDGNTRYTSRMWRDGTKTHYMWYVECGMPVHFREFYQLQFLATNESSAILTGYVFDTATDDANAIIDSVVDLFLRDADGTYRQTALDFFHDEGSTQWYKIVRSSSAECADILISGVSLVDSTSTEADFPLSSNVVCVTSDAGPGGDFSTCHIQESTINDGSAESRFMKVTYPKVGPPGKRGDDASTFRIEKNWGMFDRIRITFTITPGSSCSANRRGLNLLNVLDKTTAFDPNRIYQGYVEHQVGLRHIAVASASVDQIDSIALTIGASTLGAVVAVVGAMTGIGIVAVLVAKLRQSAKILPVV